MAFRDTAYVSPIPEGWNSQHYEKAMVSAVAQLSERLEAEVPVADCSRS